jgi:hypothetical protein
MPFCRCLTIFVLIVALAVAAGCSASVPSEGAAPGEGTHDEDGGHGGGGEHSEGSEYDEGGAEEESNQPLAPNERYDSVRNGVRLTLAYDPMTASFRGTVQNATAQNLCGVRVEVHLSNGTELGSTSPTDLSPGQRIDVELPADGETFDWWSAHPETSACSSPDGS